jgi:hypothetical protein
MYVIEEAVIRGWENFLARPGGHFGLRFYVQPAMASLIALRAGWRDARAGNPPYLWAALSDASARRQLLQGGWKDLRMVFIVAVVLDIVYQLLDQQSIYPLEVVFTATLLALVPYVILRGPISRLARPFVRRRRDSVAGD